MPDPPWCWGWRRVSGGAGGNADDPRHRLVTTKYNPARTWTPENAVGIGGAYLCVYGMEGPGGYQFVGRTVQMWNTHRSTADFAPGSPWLLRFFDQIRFYPVNGELLEMRDAFPQGKLKLDITEETFRLHDYNAFIDSIRDEAGAFKQRQQAAFEEERDRWAAAGLAEVPQAEAAAPEALAEYRVPDGCRAVQSPITGQRLDGGCPAGRACGGGPARTGDRGDEDGGCRGCAASGDGRGGAVPTGDAGHRPRRWWWCEPKGDCRMSLDITGLLDAYRAGAARPAEIVEAVYARIEAQGVGPVWIHLVSKEEALERARALEEDSARRWRCRCTAYRSR